MTYHNKTELLQLLKKEHIFAKDKYSQNFLINNEVITKIIKTAEINTEDFIVEVGPGLGILTEKLIKKAGRVRSIELDKTLYPYLEKTFGGYKSFQLEKGSALKAKLPLSNYKLVANIPYHITSPLLNHFLNPTLDEEKRATLIVLLVQKEVAEKICALPGEHSILSLNVQIFGKPEMISKVSRYDFYPAPKVDSAILKIETYNEPLIKDLKLFKQLTSVCFHQKRKTLLNTLQNFTPGLGGSKDRKNKHDQRLKTEQILANAGIDPVTRPQTLSIIQWKNLINTFNMAYVPKIPT